MRAAETVRAVGTGLVEVDGDFLVVLVEDLFCFPVCYILVSTNSINRTTVRSWEEHTPSTCLSPCLSFLSSSCLLECTDSTLLSAPRRCGEYRKLVGAGEGILRDCASSCRLRRSFCVLLAFRFAGLVEMGRYWCMSVCHNIKLNGSDECGAGLSLPSVATSLPTMIRSSSART